jgi:hypothetical protein
MVFDAVIALAHAHARFRLNTPLSQILASTLARAPPVLRHFVFRITKALMA